MKTLKEFIVEKAKEKEDKFKDLDCTSDDLTDEEKEVCNQRELVSLMRKSQAGN